MHLRICTPVLRQSLLIFFLLSSGSMAYSQYVPFLDQSQWYINTEGTLVSAFDFYTTGKDSLFNGHSWQQVLENNTTPTTAFVREELSTQRVYLSSAWNNWSERLLYDFTAQVNDTFSLDFRFHPSQQFMVTSIDQVNTTSGFVPRINLENIDGNTPANVQWTLGIGDGSHPFYLDYTGRIDTSYHLICSYQNRQKVFDDGFGHCPGIPPPLSANEVSEDLPEMLYDGNEISVSVHGKGWQWKVTDVLGHSSSGALKHGTTQIASLPKGLVIACVWRGQIRVNKKYIVRP